MIAVEGYRSHRNLEISDLEHDVLATSPRIQENISRPKSPPER